MFFSLHRSACCDRRLLPLTKPLVAKKKRRTNVVIPQSGKVFGGCRRTIPFVALNEVRWVHEVSRRSQILRLAMKTSSGKR